MQDMDNFNPNLDNPYTYDEDFENEVAKVEVGDNFAIISKELENGNQTLYWCEATFEDDWGNIRYEGDMFLCDVWYHHVLG